MEIVKCPRYISETRDLLSGARDSDHNHIEALTERIQDTSRQLQDLTSDLRSCISAHSQRQKGIIRRPGTFVGPVPEIFPETGPTLLLRGAENIQETLHQLRDRLEDKLRCRVIERLSPESAAETPTALSDGSADSPSSTSPKTSTLPFRIYSELGRGPSRTLDRNDPRAAIWLDRVASSMGVLGACIMADDETNVGYVREESSPETSSSC